MSNQRLSTQDVAAVLVEELSKIEQHTARLTQIETALRHDITKSQQISAQHIQKFEALTKRHITIDTSELERSIKRKQTLPKWAVWALILQPLLLGLLAAFLVLRYINHIERVAYSDGYNFAKQEQQKTPSQ